MVRVEHLDPVLATDVDVEEAVSKALADLDLVRRMLEAVMTDVHSIKAALLFQGQRGRA